MHSNYVGTSSVSAIEKESCMAYIANKPWIKVYSSTHKPLGETEYQVIACFPKGRLNGQNGMVF